MCVMHCDVCHIVIYPMCVIQCDVLDIMYSDTQHTYSSGHGAVQGETVKGEEGREEEEVERARSWSPTDFLA